jgi:glycosyltransferase involved in cell wall biosynthesis
LRVCLLGKFPPIQGGVSMRTYWGAHRLAARGHEVHVVTNAKEVAPPFRMHMRLEDWDRCDGDYGAGSVTVHWSDPADNSQSYIPMASAFVSKLAAIAGRLHAEKRFDVIYSHYMEPYGVAAYLAAQMSDVPHVVRMAGSDAGRLWHHPQLEALYDHVLRSAAVVIAVGPVAERAIERGVDPGKIIAGGGFAVPEDLFTPNGPPLDLAALRDELDAEPALRHLMWGGFAADRPYFGVCGKLGDSKGSFALLAAMHRLARAGLDVGLVALAHGPARVETAFRSRARKLGLADRVLQIPFLPHWRVPEFLRGCLAVCCLEQDFPIGFHSPIIPREVLLSGTCLVASTEMLRKLPTSGRLPHGYGCVAVEDVNDVEILGDRLAAIAKDPAPAAMVGARGRAFACELQRAIPVPDRLEQILEAAAARRPLPVTARAAAALAATEAAVGEFPLTRLGVAALAERGLEGPVPSERTIDLARARRVLATLERCMAEGQAGSEPLAVAVRIEVAVAEAEMEAGQVPAAQAIDPIFRLHTRRWALAPGALGKLVPVRDARLCLIELDYDAAEFMQVRSLAELPAVPTARRSFIVAFGRSGRLARDPLLVDEATAQILRLSDGTRTASDIVRQLNGEAGASAADNLAWIEGLFVRGLISLTDQRAANAGASRRAHVERSRRPQRTAADRAK